MVNFLAQSNLTYAIHDNKLVHVSDVPNGLKCECFCPACNGRLVAKKGSEKIHHFAHYNSSECQYGYETALHHLAKEIISNSIGIHIPEVYVEFNTYKSSEVAYKDTWINIENVILEKKIDNIIPDIIIYSNGKPLLIEIYVTHQIDETKLKKIKDLDLSTIEIDLSKVEFPLAEGDFKEILIDSVSNKQWIYNSASEKAYQKYIDNADCLYVKRINHYENVEGCPLNKRRYKNYTYASLFKDCLECQFAIFFEQIDGDIHKVYCTGEKKISTLNDFKVSNDIRQNTYFALVEEMKNAREKEDLAHAMNGRCPRCGRPLVQRKGKRGDFFGCSQYPYCDFTISIDDSTGEIFIKEEKL